MFSGGDYEDVARWLRNFLMSHAKREHPRIEVELNAEGEREGKSYGARLLLDDRHSPLAEFDYKDVADNRGSLTWGLAMAERTRQLARDLVSRAAERGAAS